MQELSYMDSRQIAHVFQSYTDLSKDLKFVGAEICKNLRELFKDEQKAVDELVQKRKDDKKDEGEKLPDEYFDKLKSITLSKREKVAIGKAFAFVVGVKDVVHKNGSTTTGTGGLFVLTLLEVAIKTGSRLIMEKNCGAITGVTEAEFIDDDEALVEEGVSKKTKRNGKE